MRTIIGLVLTPVHSFKALSFYEGWATIYCGTNVLYNIINFIVKLNIILYIYVLEICFSVQC